jgi:RNA polymerase sigma-70 factor (ECF subfamily)
MREQDESDELNTADFAHRDSSDINRAEEADAGAACTAPGAGRSMPRSAASEAQLIAWVHAIVAQDDRALAALYDATLARVYSMVLRLVRRPMLAEEVVEDTYFQVWRQAVRFDPARGRVLTWLLGMARSRAIDALRHEARFRHDSLDADNAPEVADDHTALADDLLDAARGHADLHRALMLLNAQPRQLVALAFFQGLSHEEIATHTALPLGTVKSQIRRALASLRNLIGEAGSQAQVAGVGVLRSGA